MNIVVGSTNPGKLKSVELAFSSLNMKDINIISVGAPSNVNSKPINEEIFIGAKNRNSYLKNYCRENNINYDYLVSIEGGFNYEFRKYYIITYAIIENNKGIEFTGKSSVIEISKTMFNLVESGKSLNDIISKITGAENNNYNQGITGYLTNGIFKRQDVDSLAVKSALMPFIDIDKYEMLEKYIEKSGD